MDSTVGDTVASAAPPPAPTDTAPASPAPAAAGDASPSPTQTNAAPADADAAPQQGTSIPYDRFVRINERMKQAEGRYRVLEDTYGDLLKFPPQQARQIAAMVRDLTTNPVGSTAQLVSALLQHPQYGPQMAAATARWAQTHSGQAGPSAQPSGDVEPDLVAENGQPVYSAGKLKQILAQQRSDLEQVFSQRLSPLEQGFRQQQAQQQFAEVSKRVDDIATMELDRARTWHGFTDHEPDITAALKANPPRPEFNDPGWSLQDAYLYVLHTKILPKLPAQAQATVVADLQQRAAAATLNPAGGMQGGPPRFDDSTDGWKKALAHFNKAGR